MALADTAQLLVNLVVKSNASSVLGKDKATLGDLGKTLFSIGGAAGFGALTAGALSAEAAQGKFMAATGESRAEAEKFVTGMDSLAGSAGSVGMKFEDIASAGTMVAQQFGTTGKATTDLTEHILEFSKVAGGDATANAAQLEDTLSSFGKTADDAAPLLDVLTASAQKFGTTDMLPTLQAMSPALQAMGANVDDGVALLNAFEVAGVDAAAAQKGLNSAITKLPKGQTLDSFIQHLQDLKNQGIDPTAEAIKVFGNKAGAGLALTLKPGGHALDDYRISAQEAAGATATAAQSMETTTDKIRGAFDKLAAGARDLGQQFGPALSGIGAITSALGPSLITGLQKAWDAVKNSDAVQSAAQSALDISGTVTGAAGTIIGNLTGNLIQVVTTSWDKVRDWLLTPGSVTQRAIAAGGAVVGTIYSAAVKLTAAVESKLQAVWVALGSPGSGVISAALSAGEAAGGSWVAGVVGVIGTAGLALIAKVGSDALSGAAEPGGKNFADNWLASVRNHTAAGAPTLQGIGADAGGQIQTGLKDEMASHAVWEPIGEAAAASLTGAMNAGVADHADELAAETAALAKGQATAYHDEVNRNKNSLSLWAITRDKQIADTKAWRELWDKSARSITGDLVGALKDAKKNVGNAMKDLLWALNHPLAMQHRLTEIQADLNSKALARGLASQYPWIQDAAKQQQQKWLDEWKQLDPKGYAAAHAASSAVQNGLNDGYPRATTDARSFVNRYNDILAGLKTHYSVGVSINNASRIARNAPRYASGGHYNAKEPRIVGEKGPELDIPDGSGMIIPAHKFATVAQPLAVAVTVNLSTREFSEQQRHYAVIQTGAPTFR
jgi:hypothetical protein